MNNKILVVDDSATVRQVIGFTLRDAGYDVDEAVDGRDALNYLAKRKYDLVVSDLNMPNLDGMGLAKEIRRDPVNRLTPIIMLTTESSEEKKAAAKEIGISCWIIKPVRPEQLIGVVRMLIR